MVTEGYPSPAQLWPGTELLVESRNCREPDEIGEAHCEGTHAQDFDQQLGREGLQLRPWRPMVHLGRNVEVLQMPTMILRCSKCAVL
jgi:hypothetical protein